MALKTAPDKIINQRAMPEEWQTTTNAAKRRTV